MAALMETQNSIRLLILDVDGVLTNGRITLDTLGREIKFFDCKDGFGLNAWKKTGRVTAIITGRSSTALTNRMEELGITHVIQGSRDKMKSLKQVFKRTGIGPEQAAAIGDDLPDLPMLTTVAYPIAVADAVPEVSRVAQFITERPGGYGAVREAIEHILKAENEWETIVASYMGDAEVVNGPHAGD